MSVFWWIVGKWRVVVPLLILALLLGTVKVQSWRLESLRAERDTLSARVSEYKDALRQLQASQEKEAVVQKRAAAAFTAAARNKGEIDEAINQAPDDGPVLPVLRDTIKRVSGRRPPSAGGDVPAARQPARVP